MNNEFDNSSDQSSGETLSRRDFGPLASLPRWLTSMCATLAVAGMVYLLQTEEQATTNAGLVSGTIGEMAVGSTVSPASSVLIESKPLAVTHDDMLGTWVLDDGMVKRVITMEEDGTAKMDVSFDFLTSLRYGSQMKLDLKWTLADNVLEQTIVDGTPESGKNTLISDFGDTAAYTIRWMKDGQMHLEEFGDNPDSYTWKKVEDSESSR